MPKVKFAISFDETVCKYALHAFGELHSPVLEYLTAKADAIAALEEIATSEDLVVLEVNNKRASPATFGTTLVAVAIQSTL